MGRIGEPMSFLPPDLMTSAGDGGRRGDDTVRGKRDVVAARGGRPRKGRDDGLAGLLLEPQHLAVDGVARAHRAAGALNAQHDGLHAAVGGSPVQLLLDVGHRGAAQQPARLRADEAAHVHQRDAITLEPARRLADDDILHLARNQGPKVHAAAGH